jgi:hypothetical protein
MVDSAEVRFLPLDSRARWAIGVLLLTVALDVVAFVSDYLEFDLYDGIVGGSHFTQGQIDATDNRQAVVAGLEFVAFVAAAIVFLLWFHGAYRNLRAVGGHQRYGEGWAIGAWFVPVLNVFRPKQIANDIWRGSDPATPHRAPADDDRVPPLLAWWWGVFLVSAWVQNIAARAFFGGSSASDIRSADRFSMAGDALDLVAALLAIVVIRAMTERQSARASALTAVA